MWSRVSFMGTKKKQSSAGHHLIHNHFIHSPFLIIPHLQENSLPIKKRQSSNASSVNEDIQMQYYHAMLICKFCTSTTCTKLPSQRSLKCPQLASEFLCHISLIELSLCLITTLTSQYSAWISLIRSAAYFNLTEYTLLFVASFKKK